MTAFTGQVPTAVLSDQLAEAIAGRRVRAAVFTTFSFDPAFFEMEVLPLLFDRPFSQVEKVKAVQLEDALRDVDALAVYYDRSALAQDAAPARLDLRRIDVRRATGVFHPKVVLALVDNDAGEEYEPVQSLVVGVLSANLTRAGWWENVEVGHFEEIEAEVVNPRRVSFRKDVLALIRRIRDAAPEDESHGALDRIHEFLTRETQTRAFENVRSVGRWYTRLFVGQESMSDWLASLNLHWQGWNLEVVSPFFDADGAATLERLRDAINPREIRVYLPRDPDGTAQVTETAYDAIAEIASWCDLPSGVLRASGRGDDGGDRQRRVHAKVYRLWGKHLGDVVLVGSVNLTRAAHSAGNAGNLEAAFLVDIGQHAPRRWWLEPIEHEPVAFDDRTEEHSQGSGEHVLDVGLRYDWGRGELQYRCHESLDGGLTFAEPSGRSLFSIERPKTGSWTRCTEEAASAVRSLLETTSFLQVSAGAHHWRILVREEGMAHRPSLLASLTPEEILRYWSLLTPEQREAFIEQKLIADGALEGLSVGRRAERIGSMDTLFDRFAGLYHAFHRLRGHVLEALESGRTAETDARLLGAKYDSLPVLLDRLVTRDDGDPILTYVAFLTAKQLWDRVRREHPDYARSRRSESRRLIDQLDRIPGLRTALPLPDDGRRDEFLEWYEEMFLAETVVPAEEPS